MGPHQALSTILFALVMDRLTEEVRQGCPCSMMLEDDSSSTEEERNEGSLKDHRICVKERDPSAAWREERQRRWRTSGTQGPVQISEEGAKVSASRWEQVKKRISGDV